jgi:CheY-like chemotaxis protein/anti-sigma regulatory factor (Ser/Thr protein kinase)
MSAQTRWFPAVPASLPEIRAFVRDLAGASGLNGDDARDVLLAVSEAADNAVQRAGASVVGVTWEPRDHAVLLTIEDDGVFDVAAGTDGRPLGLRLLFGVADEVQVRPGKPTWPGTVVRALVRVWSRAGVPDLPAPPGRPRVLLVDGDRFSGQSLAAFLHAEGYEVTLVTTIAAAESALQSHPALAVVDLLTSHGEGTRFAAVARSFGVPVVAVSAIEPATHVADAYLPKPAHPLRVLAAVRDLLSPDP